MEPDSEHLLIIDNGTFTGKLCIDSIGDNTEVKVNSLLDVEIGTSGYEFGDSAEEGYKVLTKKTV